MRMRVVDRGRTLTAPLARMHERVIDCAGALRRDLRRTTFVAAAPARARATGRANSRIETVAIDS
jgi:hypothetical protein